MSRSVNVEGNVAAEDCSLSRQIVTASAVDAAGFLVELAAWTRATGHMAGVRCGPWPAWP